MIPVERAQIGMVLTAGVTDLRGRLLIPEGKELTERYLECLPMWGVTSIEVEGDDMSPDGGGIETVEPWALEEAEEMAKAHFHLANETHPLMVALFPLCIERRAQEIQKRGQA